MMKIAIIGPPTCQRTKKVKELLFKLKRNYPDVIVVSGGNKTGIEYDTKKFALQFEMDYQEYNPSYSGFNLYSALKENYYGKGYHFTQELDRYRIMVKNVDKIVFGYEPLSPEWKKIYEPIKKYAEKNEKKFIFI